MLSGILHTHSVNIFVLSCFGKVNIFLQADKERLSQIFKLLQQGWFKCVSERRKKEKRPEKKE